MIVNRSLVSRVTNNENFEDFYEKSSNIINLLDDPYYSFFQGYILSLDWMLDGIRSRHTRQSLKWNNAEITYTCWLYGKTVIISYNGNTRQKNWSINLKILKITKHFFLDKFNSLCDFGNAKIIITSACFLRQYF